MEVQIRRHRPAQIQDQENAYINRGKANIALPAKKQGLTVRGALGDLNTNVQTQRDVNVGKVAVAAAEFEKKATLSRNYIHVQSKVDTGLSGKNASSKPLLRREESTVSHAVKAVAHTRATLKDNQTKSTETNIYIQTKKTESKKTSKPPAVKVKKEVRTLKPLKEYTESLGKLKLEEKTTSLINHTKLQKLVPLLEPVMVTSPQLPPDIEDIDAKDNDSPLLVPMYIKDIYKYLTELEVKYPVELDYLKKQVEITGKMRATLIDWLVDVQRQFSLMLETFHLTVGIIDRYLQAVPNVQRSRLQLVGVTAMFIASKYEEIYAPGIEDFVFVTDKAYSKAEVFRCERDILSKLKFCLARPIPLSFLRRFVKAASGTSKNHSLAKYFIDLSLVEYSMAHYKPSELAAAALCLSLCLLSSRELKDVWTPTMSYYSGYTIDHIVPIIIKLAKIVVNVNNSKHKAVYNRYLDATLGKVSSLPALKSEVILELANTSLSP